MQRRDFMKTAGAAALVPSVAMARGKREVLLLATPLRTSFRSIPHVPTLRGRVVLLRALDIAGHVSKGGGFAYVGGSLVRRDKGPTLEPFNFNESIEWDFNESIYHNDYVQSWKLPHRGGGCFSFDEWREFFDEFVEEHIDSLVEDADGLGLPSRFRLVVLAGCKHRRARPQAFTHGLAAAFVDGDLDWDGPVFDSREDLAAALSALIV
jgi:hypothetical protein